MTTSPWHCHFCSTARDIVTPLLSVSCDLWLTWFTFPISVTNAEWTNIYVHLDIVETKLLKSYFSPHNTQPNFFCMRWLLIPPFFSWESSVNSLESFVRWSKYIVELYVTPPHFDIAITSHLHKHQNTCEMLSMCLCKGFHVKQVDQISKMNVSLKHFYDELKAKQKPPRIKFYKHCIEPWVSFLDCSWHVTRDSELWQWRDLWHTHSRSLLSSGSWGNTSNTALKFRKKYFRPGKNSTL